MFQADWPRRGFPSPVCSAARPGQVGGGGVGDVALNSLFQASLSLMLPLTFRALKELKMARLIDLNVSLLIRWESP